MLPSVPEISDRIQGMARFFSLGFTDQERALPSLPHRFCSCCHCTVRKVCWFQQPYKPLPPKMVHIINSSIKKKIITKSDLASDHGGSRWEIFLYNRRYDSASVLQCPTLMEYRGKPWVNPASLPQLTGPTMPCSCCRQSQNLEISADDMTT